jgi:hypothetical protein
MGQIVEAGQPTFEHACAYALLYAVLLSLAQKMARAARCPKRGLIYFSQVRFCKNNQDCLLVRHKLSECSPRLLLRI